MLLLGAAIGPGAASADDGSVSWVRRVAGPSDAFDSTGGTVSSPDGSIVYLAMSSGATLVTIAYTATTGERHSKRGAAMAITVDGTAPVSLTRAVAADSKQIGILVFPDVEELDVVGPWEVLSFWTRNHPADGYTVTTLSKSGGLVECAKGLVVQSHYSYEDAPALDVLVYPGGQGTRPQLHDDAQLDWVRRQREIVPMMTSVCTGSLVYAAAGLLANRPATTHWAALDQLSDLDPTIEVRPNDRFVDDGDMVTSAGVSAGIDMALHLVRRLAGQETAKSVRRGIQYDPAPPV
jgi:putative intracellular protease/amidase